MYYFCREDLSNFDTEKSRLLTDVDSDKGFLNTTFFISLNFVDSKETRLWVHFVGQI